MSDFRNSTVYQIYIKSFADSNGDGIGDLNGIRQHLPYLKSLGIDYIWVTPFFVSPMNDNGYDVADYYSVNPMFGTMEDAEAMIREAKELGIGFMFDMVFNHTSTQHEWFQKALAGDPKYMNYYIFRDGDPDTPPTNWVSKFGGSAWEYVPHLGKWYLHLFDVSQADLNWENPEVRHELAQVIRFWKDKGLTGFRFDVVNLISKEQTFLDDHEGDGRRFYTDGPRVHEFLQELVREGGIDGMMTVGEMSSTSLDNCIRYSNPADHELKMVFSFHHLKIDYKNGDKWALQAPDLNKLHDLFQTWQEGMQEGHGWNAVFWCNHDQPRIVSRLGDDGEGRTLSAQMLGTLVHMMRGTPYIYQGEEIGMTNVDYTSIEQYGDVESINYYRILMDQGLSSEEALHVIHERSRDNGRTPMQWDEGEGAGFTTGTPWLAINSNHDEINVAAQEKDPGSVLAYYKKLVALRKEYEIIADGEIHFVESGDEHVIAYERTLGEQKLLVLCSISDEEIPLTAVQRPLGEKVLISNYEEENSRQSMRPWEAVVYLIG